MSKTKTENSDSSVYVYAGIKPEIKGDRCLKYNEYISSIENTTDIKIHMNNSVIKK